MTTIVIPFVQAFARWEELRYALRSIDKHFTGDHQVVITGDLPDWAQGIIHIPHERSNVGSGSNLFDALSKLLIAIQDARVSQKFIRWYDDCYLLEDMDKHWVLYDLKLRSRAEYSVWHKHLWCTFDALRQDHLQVWNCESHLPRVFDRSLLSEIFLRYGLPKSKLLVETLYFNHHPPSAPMLLSSADKIKAGFYGKEDLYSLKSNDVNQIRKICLSKKFLSHNDAGLSEGLKKAIMRLFPTKSRYEK
jgi:hypothetical protein